MRWRRRRINESIEKKNCEKDTTQKYHKTHTHMLIDALLEVDIDRRRLTDVQTYPCDHSMVRRNVCMHVSVFIDPRLWTFSSRSPSLLPFLSIPSSSSSSAFFLSLSFFFRLLLLHYVRILREQGLAHRCA